MARTLLERLGVGLGRGLQTFGQSLVQQRQQRAIGEREQQRIELQEEQQRMQQDEVMRELQGEQEAQLQKEEDDALERIVFRDPRGAVDRGITSIGEVRQRFPDLYDQFFNPAVVAERNRQELEDRRTGEIHESKLLTEASKRAETAAKIAGGFGKDKATTKVPPNLREKTSKAFGTELKLKKRDRRFASERQLFEKLYAGQAAALGLDPDSIMATMPTEPQAKKDWWDKIAGAFGFGGDDTTTQSNEVSSGKLTLGQKRQRLAELKAKE